MWGGLGILGSGSKRQLLPLRRGTRKAQVSACELNNADLCFCHRLHYIVIFLYFIIWKSFVYNGGAKITKNWDRARRCSDDAWHNQMVPKKRGSSPQTQKRCLVNQVLPSVKEEPVANISFWLRPYWHLTQDLDLPPPSSVLLSKSPSNSSKIVHYSNNVSSCDPF